MISSKTLFLKHLAQTSSYPLLLEIEKGKGIYLFDKSGKKYIDLISGVSVNNIGHSHPAVIKAIYEQLNKHLHLMVYGEYVQKPQIEYAKLLTEHLPPKLNCIYFVNSGTEANEGALKLAKRFTGRSEIIACKNAYHGSTHGSLSVSGNETLKNSFRPLLPDIRLIEFNNERHLLQITEKSACIIIEPVQGEAGVIIANNEYLKKIRKRCNKTGTLLIFDETQTGIGRTGSLFAFEQFDVVPDILVLGKALGGGLPLGAFISSKKIMNALKTNPPFGHITTFGGNPLSCVAGMSLLKIILSEKLIPQIKKKEELFRKLLVHPQIKAIRSRGLLIAIEFETRELCGKVIRKCIKNGVIIDSFLFNDKSVRISPPLIITEEGIRKACKIIIKSIDEE